MCIKCFSLKIADPRPPPVSQLVSQSVTSLSQHTKQIEEYIVCMFNSIYFLILDFEFGTYLC